MECEIVPIFTFYYIYIKTKCNYVINIINYKFTFYYIYIKTAYYIDGRTYVDIFTFYYIYIKTGVSQIAIFLGLSPSNLSITNYFSIIFIKNQYQTFRNSYFTQLAVPVVLLEFLHFYTSTEKCYKKFDVFSSSIFPRNSLSSHF